jgi:ABC-type branched-subunit amino acid transport system ATPase component
MVSEAAGGGAIRGDLGANGNPGAWIDIRRLGKHFAGEVALRDVDMDVARGEVHGLVGANGAGKSTLIRCLAGVTVPDEGRILVGGEELRLGSPKRRKGPDSPSSIRNLIWFPTLAPFRTCSSARPRRRVSD